jgi:hypothetical protein
MRRRRNRTLLRVKLRRAKKDSSVCCHNRIKYVSNEVNSFLTLSPAAGIFVGKEGPRFAVFGGGKARVFFGI